MSIPKVSDVQVFHVPVFKRESKGVVFNEVLKRFGKQSMSPYFDQQAMNHTVLLESPSIQGCQNEVWNRKYKKRYRAKNWFERIRTEENKPHSSVRPSSTPSEIITNLMTWMIVEIKRRQKCKTRSSTVATDNETHSPVLLISNYNPHPPPPPKEGNKNEDFSRTYSPVKSEPLQGGE